MRACNTFVEIKKENTTSYDVWHVSVVKKRNMTQTNEQIYLFIIHVHYTIYAAHIKHAFSHFFLFFLYQYFYK